MGNTSNSSQWLIVGIIVLFFVWWLLIGKYLSNNNSITQTSQQNTTTDIAQQTPQSSFLIGEQISNISGNIAPSLSINNATAYSHILTTSEGTTFALKSKILDLNNLGNPILIESWIVVDITTDWLPIVEVYQATSLAQQQEEDKPQLNIIPFTGYGFELNFGNNSWYNAYLDWDKLVIMLSWETKFEGYLKDCQSFGMSCSQLHQTFQNVSPPLTNQYGIDFFKYAETTGNWIVIFDNKFMNMVGSQDYIKSYFNYFAPLWSSNPSTTTQSDTQNNETDTTETQTTQDQPTTQTDTNQTDESTQTDETQSDTPNLDNLNSYTFKAWFTVYFPKTASYQMLTNSWDTLKDCKYVINTIYYKNADQLQTNPDLQIFVCDAQPDLPAGSKLLEAQGKYFVVVPLTDQGQERKDIIYVQ